MPWEQKSAKHHVEDEEDYNREERRHFYINYHSLLHQYLFLSLQDQLSPSTRSKKKEKIQKKRDKNPTI